MHSDSLNKLLVAFESLRFTEFIWTDLPQDGWTIERSRYKIIRVVWPAKVHHIADMASELSRLTPLNFLFKFSKLDRNRLESPNDNKLIVACTCQVQSVGRKPDTVHCFLVSSLQIVQVLRLDLECTKWFSKRPKFDSWVIISRKRWSYEVLFIVWIPIDWHYFVSLVMPWNLRDICLHLNNYKDQKET